MPGITFNYEDFSKLTGKKLDEKTFVKYLERAKAELESNLTRETNISYNDTNQPWLWSVEGLARFFRCQLGKHNGIPPIKVKKAKDKVIYDAKLKKIRPHIACFKATGKKIDAHLLDQLIQLQEKLTENFGKKREKISIGVYPLRPITFPVYCKAANPRETFTPLDFHHPLSLAETLEKHPKGKLYGHLIENNKYYPVFMDADKNILSLIPVINSEHTGKVQEGDDSLFFDTTGMDEESVNLAANIFAYALADRGFTIEALTIEYPNKKITTPTLKNSTIRIKEKDVERILGIKLKTTDIKKLLGKMGYKYNKGTVTIPSYRHDIMHPVDVIEDIAIAYGYDNFEPKEITSYTPGSTFPIQHFIDAQRDLWAGMGYQEVMTAVLSNKELLYDNMNTEDTGTVEIENFVSQTYSCVRTWILPILLNILSTNKHVDYPQRLFEQGIVTKRDKQAIDNQHLAAVSAHTGATFTEMRQAIEATLRGSNMTCTFEEYDHDSFIPGRAARVLINNKPAGFLGELHPQVLEQFNLAVPAAACELNLSSVYEQKKK